MNDYLIQFQSLFSWQILLTFSGLLAFTCMATEYLKSKIKLDARTIAFAVATITSILATIFTGNGTAGNIALCLVNGFYVSAFAVAGHSTVDKILRTINEKKNDKLKG